MRRPQLRGHLARGLSLKSSLGTDGWVKQASCLINLQLQPHVQGWTEQTATKQMGSWPEGNPTEQAQRLSAAAHLFQQADQHVHGRAPIP